MNAKLRDLEENDCRSFTFNNGWAKAKILFQKFTFIKLFNSFVLEDLIILILVYDLRFSNWI